MSVVDNSFGSPLNLEEKASMVLAGGLANQGYQCGLLWGAALAAGAQVYRLMGQGPQAEVGAMIASQRIVESFRARTNNEINCLEIMEMSNHETNQTLQILKFLRKGGPIGCLRMAAGYAPEAFSAINSAFSEKHIEAPSPPVSCTARLAQKMGASDLHTVMAAGLAGGIGLSGGACGALGAAIWIASMNCSDPPVGFNFTESWASEIIEKFLEISDYDFECSKIAGCKFENISDHAKYLGNGGCSHIIEGLAAISSAA